MSGTDKHHVFSDAELLRRLFEKSQVNSKLMRYRYRIANYKVHIHHLSGNLNSLADCLSRDDFLVHKIANSKPLTLDNPQFGNEFDTICDKVNFTVSPNLNPITIPKIFKLTYKPDSHSSLCYECHQQLISARVYDIHGILSTTCKRCDSPIPSIKKSWNCMNQQLHVNVHSYCENCVNNSCCTIDDIDWRIRNSLHHDKIKPRYPLHQHFNESLTFTHGLHVHKFFI